MTYRVANPSSSTKAMRKRRRLDPEPLNAASRRCYWKYRDKRLQEMREWKRSNKDRYLAGYAEWKAKNPTYFRDWQRKRRMKLAWAKWISGIKQARASRCQ